MATDTETHGEGREGGGREDKKRFRSLLVPLLLSSYPSRYKIRPTGISYSASALHASF